MIFKTRLILIDSRAGQSEDCTRPQHLIKAVFFLPVNRPKHGRYRYIFNPNPLWCVQNRIQIGGFGTVGVNVLAIVIFRICMNVLLTNESISTNTVYFLSKLQANFATRMGSRYALVPHAFVLLLITQTQVVSPRTMCPADSFYKTSLGVCEECTKFCPAGTKMVRPCRNTADTVCGPSKACPVGSFHNQRTGDCEECVRFCTAPLVMVKSCRLHEDAVCGSFSERRPPVSTAPSSAASRARMNKKRTRGKVPEIEEAQPSQTNMKTGRMPTTSQSENLESSPNVDTSYKVISLDPNNVPLRPFSFTTQPQPEITSAESGPFTPEVSQAAPVTDGETTSEMTFHLWIVISILAGVVVVVVSVVLLLVCCANMMTCGICDREDEKMGVAGSKRDATHVE